MNFIRWNIQRRLLPILAFAAVLGSEPLYSASSIPLPGNNSKALLRVSSLRQVFFGPNISQFNHSQTLISRGGGLFTLVSVGMPGFPLGTNAFKGLGTEEELAILGQALVEARVGQQGDCTLGSSGLGHAEITWYGRTGRQNTFRVTFQEESPPAEQRCPDSVFFLVEAIDRFIDEAVSGFPQD